MVQQECNSVGRNVRTKMTFSLYLFSFVLFVHGYVSLCVQFYLAQFYYRSLGTLITPNIYSINIVNVWEHSAANTYT